MASVFTRKRLVIWLVAFTIAGSLWVLRWQLLSLVMVAIRASKKPLAAQQWLASLARPEGITLAAPMLAEVAEGDLPVLLRYARDASEDRGLAVEWLLLERGYEPAAAALSERVRAGRPIDTAATLPWVDLAAECAFRQPVTPIDRRLKEAAARLLLAGPMKGPSDIDRWLAQAVLGTPPPPAAAEWLDDGRVPAATRLKAHILTALSGEKGAAQLEQRLLGSSDERVRAWSAQGLLAGLPGPEARKAAASRLEQAGRSGRAVEPELAAAAARNLRWEPRS